MSTQELQTQTPHTGPFKRQYEIVDNRIKRDQWSLKAFMQGKKTLFIVVQTTINAKKNNIQDAQRIIFGAQSVIKLAQRKMCDAQSVIKLVQREICDAQSVIKLAQREICDAQSVIKLAQREICDAQSVIKLAQREICDVQSVIKFAQKEICDVQKTIKEIQVYHYPNAKYPIHIMTSPEHRQTVELNSMIHQCLFKNYFDKSGITNSQKQTNNYLIFKNLKNLKS